MKFVLALLLLLCPLSVQAQEGLGLQWESEVRDRFGSGKGNYQPPTEEEQTLGRRLTQAVRGGKTQKAQELADKLGYEVSSVGPDLWLYQDLHSRGWGRILARHGSATGWVVEVPHPWADRGTPEIGLRLFTALKADVLLVAGAHRRNHSKPSPDRPFHSLSDMTHTRATMFQAWHAGAVQAGERVVQVHGFSAARAHRRYPEFPVDREVVISDGANDGYDPPTLKALYSHLREEGLSVSLVSFTDKPNSHLGATTNVQRDDLEERALVGAGKTGEFIHLELSESLRAESSLNRTCRALARAFSKL